MEETNEYRIRLELTRDLNIIRRGPMGDCDVRSTCFQKKN